MALDLEQSVPQGTRQPTKELMIRGANMGGKNLMLDRFPRRWRGL
jgi:hypothetical protein